MKETINHAELVKQAVNGDNAAFEEIYRTTVKSAYRTANLILSNPSDAEDVVQNAYIKAAEKLPELKNPESFESWLKSIVENECKNYIRKEKRITAPFTLLKRKAEEVSKEPVETVPQEIIEREDLQKDITEIVNSLSPETRACIVLFHFEDKSLNEIAEILNIPVGTVKSRLYNGRKKIEKQFDKLRKKDPTLYGIGAIPVLLSFIALQSQEITVPAAISTAAAVTAGTTAASTAAGSTAAVTATAGTALSAGTAAVTTATAVTVKVAAIAVAGALAVGGTAVIKKQIEKNSEQTIQYSVESEEEGTAATTQSYSTESLSEETNTESNTVQSTSSVHTASQVVTPIASSHSNITTAFTESQTQQTTAAATQKPSETTSNPTTQAPTTIATQPATQSTTPLATEATQPPTTNPENNYSSASGVITEYNGSDKNVSIPSSIGGNTVTAIGVGAFQGNTNITSVSLPNTVTQIGQEAFAECSSLSSVSLPVSLKQIGIGAFYGCSSLSSVNVPDSVTTISDEAFANCTALKSVAIPASVTQIADDAFNGCDSLTIICTEGSTAHNFAVNNLINYTIIN